MSVTKTEIFIASRFEEFAELRSALKNRINSFPVFPLQAVDLNDNVAGGHAPLGKCLAAVKQAEVMILLVGDSYGEPAGEELSYTHHEYRTALDDTVVLAFFIGQSSIGNRFSGYATEERLKEWQKEIKERHTPAFIDPGLEVREQCAVIFDAAYKALYDARSTTVQKMMDNHTRCEDLDPDDVLDLDADDSVGLSHDEMERLDSRNGRENELFASDAANFQNVQDILLRPAEAAAFEQKNEAAKAIDLGNRFIAIRHLRRALELRPLDFSATYWLARLLVSSGKKEDLRDAVRYGLMAAKMSSFAKRPVKAATSLMIAAKAASILGDSEEALEYAQRAVQETPWLAAAHIELASQLAATGQVDEALKEVHRAFVRRPQIILRGNREPNLVKLGQRYQEFKKNLHASVLKEATQLLNDEVKARQMLTGGEEALPAIRAQIDRLPARPLLNLCIEGRKAAQRQLAYLQQQAVSLQSVDDDALGEYESRRLGEHERTRAIIGVEMDAAWESHRVILKHFLRDAVGALILFALIRPLLPKTLPLVVLAVLAGLAIVYFIITARRYRDLSEQLSDLEQRRSESDSATSSVSTEVAEMRQEASAKVRALYSAIAAFEKHVVQSQLFSMGRSIKAARPGDLVAIDASLQADVLCGADVDDLIVPASLSSHFPGESFPHQGRMRLYSLVDYRDGKPVFSRSAVYFGATGTRLKAPQPRAVRQPRTRERERESCLVPEMAAGVE